MTALTALSIDMSLPAQPVLQRLFHAGVAPVQLTLSLFLLGFAVGQIVCGPLSDRRGRRPVLLAGLVVFALAGLCCAATPSLPLLIACRFVQGLGASVGPIIARTVVRDCYDHRTGASVLSQITQVMMIAPLLAPTVGGWLVAGPGWRAIFLLLAASGLLLWAACRLRLPETRAATAHNAWGESAWVGFRAVARNRAGAAYTVVICFAYSGMFAYISGSPFVLMDVFHVSGTHFGFFFALTAAALLVGATVNRVLLPRYSPTSLLGLGMGLLFAAAVSLALLAWARVGGLAGVLGPMALYLFALGLVVPNATAAAMAPHGQRAGVASSAIGSLQTAGGALAGFLVGAFFDHTPLSLAFIAAAFALLAVGVFLWCRRLATTAPPDAEAGAVGLLLVESAE